MTNLWNTFWQQDTKRRQFGAGPLDYEQPDSDLIEFSQTHQLAGTCLDIGCGDGRNAAYVEKIGLTVTGIDISSVAIRKAKTRGLVRTTFQVGSMFRLPLASASFDLVMCLHTIFHAKRAQIIQALAEIRRVLKPNGAGLITFIPLEGNEHRLGEKIEPLTYRTTDGDDAGELHHFCHEKEILQLVTAAGFPRIRELTKNPIANHWVVII